MHDPETRPELLLAALLHLITAYRRRACPALASCIARHFACLATHPRAHRLIRDVAAGAAPEWERAADVSCEAADVERRRRDDEKLERVRYDANAGTAGSRNSARMLLSNCFAVSGRLLKAP